MTWVANPSTRMRYSFDVLSHLVGREFRLRYQRAMLGWVWAIAEPLARMVVLAFVFTRVVPLGIPNYATFLFTGLIAWVWFASALRSVTTSVVDRSDLLMHPKLPRLAAPVVSALADGLDFLAALPVLFVFLILGDGIPITALLLPAVMVIQLLLILGIGLLLASAHVYMRDTGQLVDVAMTLGFYVTPVFYETSSVPEAFQSVMNLNPMTHLLAVYRGILVDGSLPSAGTVGALLGLSALLFALGIVVHLRTSPYFVDEL